MVRVHLLTHLGLSRVAKQKTQLVGVPPADPNTGPPACCTQPDLLLPGWQFWRQDHSYNTHLKELYKVRTAERLWRQTVVEANTVAALALQDPIEFSVCVAEPHQWRPALERAHAARVESSREPARESATRLAGLRSLPYCNTLMWISWSQCIDSVDVSLWLCNCSINMFNKHL